MKTGQQCDIRACGWTLVELIVTLAILALLLGLSFSGVQRVRATAARVACQSRIGQVAMACHSYHARSSFLPVGQQYGPRPYNVSDSTLSIRSTWPLALLNDLEQSNLATQFETLERTGSMIHLPPFEPIWSRHIAILRCPNDSRDVGESSAFATYPTRFGLNNYLGNAGTGLVANDGMFHRDRRVSLINVTDGTSSTLLFGERPSFESGARSAWYPTHADTVSFIMPVNPVYASAGSESSGCTPEPSVFESGHTASPCHAYHYWSLHSGGANFAFADGHVSFLRYSAATILPALATRNGGESVMPD